MIVKEHRSIISNIFLGDSSPGKMVNQVREGSPGYFLENNWDGLGPLESPGDFNVLLFALFLILDPYWARNLGNSAS